MQALAAVVGIWLCAVLMLIGVDGLGWWAAECLRSNVYGGGVCGYLSVGVRSLRRQVGVGCKVCRMGG